MTATSPRTIEVIQTALNFEREQLVSPFGFKGGYLSELWQVVSQLRSANGFSATGLATQSVLYGDADLFAEKPEDVGNSLMYRVTGIALDLLRQTTFTDPIQLLEIILPELLTQARHLTSKPDLNVNFVYNALVSVDNAAWLLYAAENGKASFAEMVPQAYQNILNHRNEKVALMFMVPYGMPVEDVIKAANEGYFVFKIKTGHPGTQQEMLEKDIARLTQVHSALKDIVTAGTPDGRILYTMDANGRYEKKDTLNQYLDHARHIGAFERILLYEEPFTDSNNEDVRDINLRIAADESAYDEASALRRLDLGYSVLVLKGIAKTLSLSLKIAALAAQRGIPCICSDLTVNPILVDWHKNLCAGLAPFPGLNMGLMETNGDVNYLNWPAMSNYHPAAGAGWTQVNKGMFQLNDDFYQHSGGIFQPSAHYQTLVE